jgi:hypothetical protein
MGTVLCDKKCATNLTVVVLTVNEIGNDFYIDDEIYNQKR